MPCRGAVPCSLTVVLVVLLLLLLGLLLLLLGRLGGLLLGAGDGPLLSGSAPRLPSSCCSRVRVTRLVSCLLGNFAPCFAPFTLILHAKNGEKWIDVRAPFQDKSDLISAHGRGGHREPRPPIPNIYITLGCARWGKRRGRALSLSRNVLRFQV